MKYRPSIPDSIKHWQVFDNDKEIEWFLQVIDEFSGVCMDQENINEVPTE